MCWCFSLIQEQEQHVRAAYGRRRSSCPEKPQSVTHPTDGRMQSRCYHQSTGLGQDRTDHLDLQMKVDFFRKLGYSPEEVKAALRKLGFGTDTNAVLGELVRSGAKAVPSSSSDSDDGGFSLPHRGGSSSRGQGSTPEDNSEPESDLKPIVIDGSNVAMRWGRHTAGLSPVCFSSSTNF